MGWEEAKQLLTDTSGGATSNHVAAPKAAVAAAAAVATARPAVAAAAATASTVYNAAAATIAQHVPYVPPIALPKVLSPKSKAPRVASPASPAQKLAFDSVAAPAEPASASETPQKSNLDYYVLFGMVCVVLAFALGSSPEIVDMVKKDGAAALKSLAAAVGVDTKWVTQVAAFGVSLVVCGTAVGFVIMG